MKKVFFLFTILVLVSCATNKNEITSNKVIIAGKVLNQDPNVFEVRLTVNRIGTGKERLSPALNNDGSFKVIFESEIPTDVWLLYKTNFLILTHPGDSIYLEFDGSKEERSDILKTLTFNGDAKTLNSETAAFQEMYFTQSIFYSYSDKKQQILRDYNEVQYKIFMDSVRHEYGDIYDKFLKEKRPSREAKKWAKVYLDVDYYRDLIAYPYYHRMANNLKSEEWNVPITYFDFLNNHFQFNDSILICGYSLSSFVNSYPVYLQEKIKNENKQFYSSIDTIKKYPAKSDSIRFFGTIKYTEDPLLRQMVLTEMLSQELSQSSIRMFEKYKNIIDSIIQEPYLKEPLFKLYQQTIERLDNPKLASDAILQKINGTTVKSEINKIISTNKGKIIYMDCWATWCGPCVSEMPNSKKLIELYKTKDVAFIFICLDSEERNWKSILSKFSIGGQHFLLDKNQSSDFRGIFGISGIPHYILFDKEGNIYENGTLPPGAVKEKLDKLLN